MICFLNKGITDPFEFRTLPKRTAAKVVTPLFLKACTINSTILFVAPITLVGLTALSVEIRIKVAALNVIHDLITL
ncbi:hypothetical protein SDC9_126111 [bioreactor metagenome]|uniref:Uncharacterized protein n=1 Tax=bioreactor metagenome TaxID=1076179 RepID=A0A645CPQ8_9ZZZZ